MVIHLDHMDPMEEGIDLATIVEILDMEVEEVIPDDSEMDMEVEEEDFIMEEQDSETVGGITGGMGVEVEAFIKGSIIK